MNKKKLITVALALVAAYLAWQWYQRRNAKALTIDELLALG